MMIVPACPVPLTPVTVPVPVTSILRTSIVAKYIGLKFGVQVVPRDAPTAPPVCAAADALPCVSALACAMMRVGVGDPEGVAVGGSNDWPEIPIIRLLAPVCVMLTVPEP